MKADYIVTDESFIGLSPIVAETLAEVPELSAVTPIRSATAEVDGESKPFGAIEPVAFEQLIDPDLIDGTIGDLGFNELLINSDPAADLGRRGRVDRHRDVPERRAESSSPWPASTATARSATG